MTKRKITQKPSATINPTPPKQAVESDKVESNTVATTKTKRANSKAPAKPRGRPKKVVIEQVYEILPLKQPTPPEGKVVPEVTYVAPNRAILVADKPPSLCSRFKAWLVFKLYHYTSFFKGY